MSSVKQQQKETMPHREPKADNHSDENLSRFPLNLTVIDIHLDLQTASDMNVPPSLLPH